jgi:hypothetical protein
MSEFPPRGALTVSYGEACDRGKVREENQDSIRSAAIPLGDLFIVADGIGGYQGGATASRMVVEGFLSQLAARPPTTRRPRPRRSLQLHQRLHPRRRQHRRSRLPAHGFDRRPGPGAARKRRRRQHRRSGQLWSQCLDRPRRRQPRVPHPRRPDDQDHQRPLRRPGAHQPQPDHRRRGPQPPRRLRPHPLARPSPRRRNRDRPRPASGRRLAAALLRRPVGLRRRRRHRRRRHRSQPERRKNRRIPPRSGAFRRRPRQYRHRIPAHRRQCARHCAALSHFPPERPCARPFPK